MRYRLCFKRYLSALNLNKLCFSKMYITIEEEVYQWRKKSFCIHHVIPYASEWDIESYLSTWK